MESPPKKWKTRPIGNSVTSSQILIPKSSSSPITNNILLYLRKSTKGYMISHRTRQIKLKKPDCWLNFDSDDHPVKLNIQNSFLLLNTKLI